MAVCADEPAEGAAREAIVRRLLDRSQFLEDAHFQVPLDFYRQWLRRVAEEAGQLPQPPVDCIRELSECRLSVPSEGQPTLTLTLRLDVLRPKGCRNLPLLSAAMPWRQTLVNGKPADLVPLDGWLCFSPDAPGRVEVVAETTLPSADSDGRRWSVAVQPAVRNLLQFDSPQAWEVSAAGAVGRLTGSAAAGTHGRLPLVPGSAVDVLCERPRPAYERPPRYELRGDAAWNFDASSQQLVADLVVTVADGASDQFDLLLPPTADRVTVTGPDIRDVRVAGGAAHVVLRQKLSGATRLQVRCEMTTRQGGLQNLAQPAIRDGHWTGGTLVLTSTAGGCEVVPESVAGLEPLALADIGPDASAILPGKAILAYRIAGRSFNADVDVVDLAAYALRETLADTAHWQLALRGDGTVMCKASIQVRNRTRQFLEVALPPGAVVLAVRVNEQPRPMSLVPGRPDVYLLPLERSTVSVEGLISFPVEIVCLYRIDRLAQGRGRTQMTLPVPQIDLPIAYAWAEVYTPENLSRPHWSGPLERVDEYADKTASATLGYGRGEKAKAFDPTGMGPRPFAVADLEPIVAEAAVGYEPDPARQQLLARNYYRAGKDFYDRGEYAQAAEAFRNVSAMAPESVEAANARLYLANPMVSGAADVSKASQKAALKQIKEDVAASNLGYVEQQRQFLEQGRRLSASGKKTEAAEQFRAAKALGSQLVARGESQREQEALLRDATEQLAEADRRAAAEMADQWARVEQLKSEGRYKDALDAVRGLSRSAQVQGPGMGIANGVLWDSDVGWGDRIRKELEELTLKVAKAQSGGQDEKDRLWQLSMRYMNSREYDKSAQALDRLLDIDPQNERARRLRDDAAYLHALDKSLEKRTEGRRASGSSASAAPRSRQDAEESAAPFTEIYRYPDEKQWERLAERRREGIGIAKDSWLFDEDIPGGPVPPKPTGTVPEVGRYDEDSDAPAPDFGATAPRMQLTASKGRQPRSTRSYRVEGDAEQAARLVTDLIGAAAVAADAPAQAPGQAGQTTVRVYGDRLIVSGAEAEQRQVKTLLDNLRASQAPQVEISSNIITQRAKGVIVQPEKPAATSSGDGIFFDERGPTAGDIPTTGSLFATESRTPAAAFDDNDKQFQEFIGRNYDWALKGNAPLPPTDSGHQPARSSSFAFKMPNQPVPDPGTRRHNESWDEGATDEIINFDVVGVGGGGYSTGGIAGGGTSFFGVGSTATSVAFVVDTSGSMTDSIFYVKCELKHAIARLTPNQQFSIVPTASGSPFAGGEAVPATESNKQAAYDYIDALAPLGQSDEAHAFRNAWISKPQAVFLLSDGEMGRDAVETLDRLNADHATTVNTVCFRYTGGEATLMDIAHRHGGTYKYIGEDDLDFVEEGPPAVAEAPVPPPEDLSGLLAAKAASNLGQIVPVNSINLNVPAAEAAGLGIALSEGANGVVLGTIDEAQLRTLLELDARRSVEGRLVDNNERLQETIVGTDARFANDWTGNVAFGGESFNRLDINGNPVDLPHGKYVLIDNGRFLTAVRAGRMRHWTEKVELDDLRFAEVPQTIEVPRVGRLVKFEKRLVKPTDRLVIHCDYVWKGATE